MAFSVNMNAIQSGNRQDYATGGLQKNGVFGCVCDGHGTSKVINLIREMPMAVIAQSSNPIQDIFERVQASGDTTLSGSTATFVTMEMTDQVNVKVWHAGDSMVEVFINGIRIHQTIPHTLIDPNEIERTRSKVVLIEPKSVTFPITPTCIGFRNSPLGHYLNGDTKEMLVPSMALGHDNMTGMDPAFEEFMVDPSSTIRVVCVSDGVSDMLVDLHQGSASDITAEALRRWRQKWDLTDGKHTWHGQVFPDYDDVACVVCEYTP